MKLNSSEKRSEKKIIFLSRPRALTYTQELKKQCTTVMNITWKSNTPLHFVFVSFFFSIFFVAAALALALSLYATAVAAAYCVFLFFFRSFY